MSKHILNELPVLVKDGVIDDAISDRIENYYRQKERSQPDGRINTVFAIIGTVLGAVAASRNGARQCLQPSAKINRDACRSFVMDVPWSAAFVSYVMVQAGVPQFTASPGHIHYIRAAWQQRGPYTLQDPEQTAVAAVDMLCYIRNHPQIEGYQGLRAFLAVGDEWLPAHCDIVVAIRGQEAWLVGGNVSNTVAMRKLPLDGQGRALLPRPPGAGNTNPAAACSPENEAACNMNRQNWAALLQLKPETP